MIKLNKYRFDELYKMSSGISTSKEQAGYGYPFVSFSTIFNNPILPDKLSDLMNTSEEEQNTYSVKKGDILLTRTSETLDELAMSSVAIKDYSKATFSGFAKRLRPLQNDITYDKFMAFYLRSDYFRKIINNNATMTLRASFNETLFSYIQLLLPEYETQVKIGDLFYHMEEKIRNNNKINEELECMAKTIYDYWFLQFEFPNEEGKPYKSSGGKMVWNEELKREIPEGWECVKLDEIFNFVKGKIPTEIFCECNETHSIPYLTIDAINNNNYEYCLEENMILTDGEVLMVMDGAASSEVYVGNKGAIGSTFCKLELKDKLVSNELLYLIMKKYESIFKKVNTGSTVPHANKNYINNFKICLPKDNIQLEKIQKHIIMNIKQINMRKRENKELASLRDFLLPLLISGQVGFRELALAED